MCLDLKFLVNKNLFKCANTHTQSIIINLMSISSTVTRKRQLPVGIAQGGSGAFIFDPHTNEHIVFTETVQAVTAVGQSIGVSPSKESEQISSKTDAANTQNAENISREHSKTELQTLSLQKSQIKVHEIIGDVSRDDSMAMNINKQVSEASKTSASPVKGEQQNEASIKKKAGESNWQPKVMRFCPSLSTKEVDISLSGKSQLFMIILIHFGVQALPLGPSKTLRLREQTWPSMRVSTTGKLHVQSAALPYVSTFVTSFLEIITCTDAWRHSFPVQCVFDTPFNQVLNIIMQRSESHQKEKIRLINRTIIQRWSNRD